MTKRILFILILTSSFSCILNSQSIVSQGKPVTEVYADFHYYHNDTTKTTGFAIPRAYLGYNYTPEGNFSALIIVNIGTPEDLSDGATPKRYGYFREASVTYQKEKLKLSFGMVSTRIFDFQQGFWGKRYLGPEYQAAYPYGSVADLGMVLDYKISDLLKVDLSLLNGKGYTNIQPDNSLKSALGLAISTPNKIFVRLYGDIMKPHGVIQTTLVMFAGHKNNFFSIGTEASYKTNLDLVNGHDIWGISATGSIFLNEKSEIFARYDYAASVILQDEELQWNYKKDNTYFIGGIQHKLSNNLKIALNFRRQNPYNPGQKTTDAIYLNAHFKF
jgi:hypothetical protein